MSVFLHVTMDVEAAGMGRFLAVMAEITPILEGQGWRLAGAFLQRTGRLNTVIDLWELRDFNHYDEALKQLTAHPRFPELAKTLAETVRNETVVFADKAPYMR
jgi:hypothetical protein